MKRVALCAWVRRSDLNLDEAGQSGSPPMNDPRLKLEMQEGAIVISLPGTNYQVTYRRLADSPGMRASHNLTDDQDAPITPFEFLERAWIIARDKARELGWIV
jgi:hypothetical protein